MGLYNNDFMEHESTFKYLNIIQAFDILLTFFKVMKIDVIYIDNPNEIAMNYLTGQFMFDVVSTIPWSMVNSSYIFLRFLKIRKFFDYQKYFDEFLTELLQNIMNFEQIKGVINSFNLMFQIMFVSHFLANIWILLGMYEMYHNDSGWIVMLINKEIQIDDYSSVYVTSLYWIITTFSSVGYGDCVGST